MGESAKDWAEWNEAQPLMTMNRNYLTPGIVKCFSANVGLRKLSLTYGPDHISSTPIGCGDEKFISDNSFSRDSFFLFSS